MKKTIFTALLFLAIVSPTGAETSHNQQKDTDKVYVCTGKSSKRYHKTDKCKGLRSCSRDIIAVSVAKAKGMGRTPCKMCY
jgi:hypothetical protein